ncbi:glycosyltransferase family 4 protein [Rhodococcus sp. 14-1411-2a]|uniref:glycosyltransferase family 4 protein n=1 Tax=Rhodococcus sp. 14-1411-2a TaxID=2023151 RepID=UPI000B9BF2BB|nr:glycosyltransferase family 4 protein [Rhodococcus sp. 14-1411-2a]OZF51286.1 hypothetical protein CH291_06895 [Rhodococcus sp. 14-1411-2a]
MDSIQGPFITADSEEIVRIAIVGPVSPRGLASFFNREDAVRAMQEGGNYGQAPTALAAALCDAGHSITVVSHRRGQPSLELRGPTMRFIQVASRMKAGRQALDWWREERQSMVAVLDQLSVDIIHAHWTYEWAAAALSSTAAPTVITARDAPLTILRYQSDAYRLLRTVLAYNVRVRARNSLILAASPYMAERWRREMFWYKPIPIAPNLVSSAVSMRGIAKTENPSIVEIADSSPRKNVWKLLESFAMVRSDFENSTLTLIGDGLSENDSLYLRACAANLTDGVRFAGMLEREPLLKILEQSWIHAHLSVEESFGNTLVEAMALRTSVVGGAKSGAVPWVLGDGVCGELVEVNDVIDVSNRLKELISNPDRRRQFTDNGLLRLKEVFSAEAVVRLHIDSYSDAIGGLN